MQRGVASIVGCRDLQALLGRKVGVHRGLGAVAAVGQRQIGPGRHQRQRNWPGRALVPQTDCQGQCQSGPRGVARNCNRRARVGHAQRGEGRHGILQRGGKRVFGRQTVGQVIDAVFGCLGQPCGQGSVRDARAPGVGATVQIQDHAPGLNPGRSKPFTATTAHVCGLHRHIHGHLEEPNGGGLASQSKFRQRKILSGQLGQLVLDQVVQNT